MGNPRIVYYLYILLMEIPCKQSNRCFGTSKFQKKYIFFFLVVRKWFSKKLIPTIAPHVLTQNFELWENVKVSPFDLNFYTRLAGLPYLKIKSLPPTINKFVRVSLLFKKIENLKQKNSTCGQSLGIVKISGNHV